MTDQPNDAAQPATEPTSGPEAGPATELATDPAGEFAAESASQLGTEPKTVPASVGPMPDAARDVFGERLPLAIAYHDSLATTGLVRGFIGPREVSRLWERHLLNCAVLGEGIGKHARVVDIGSGAGLPGIPLAIARPDIEITLVEPLLKRSTYLREIVTELGLDNVQVIRGRAEEPQVRKQAGGADIVTSRAVAPLGKLVGWSLPLLRPGGKMVALKGSSVTEELARDAKQIKKAGGGMAVISTAGEGKCEIPSTLVSITRLR